MTDEQINRDIAEWCGFKQNEVGKTGFHWEWGERMGDWIEPNGKTYYYYGLKGHRPNFLDEIQGLGLLFKYAVPKLDRIYDISFVYRETPEWLCSMSLWSRSGYIEAIDKSPTRALAMAIWKVIKEASHETTD